MMRGQIAFLDPAADRLLRNAHVAGDLRDDQERVAIGQCGRVVTPWRVRGKVRGDRTAQGQPTTRALLGGQAGVRWWSPDWSRRVGGQAEQAASRTSFNASRPKRKSPR